MVHTVACWNKITVWGIRLRAQKKPGTSTLEVIGLQLCAPCPARLNKLQISVFISVSQIEGSQITWPKGGEWKMEESAHLSPVLCSFRSLLYFIYLCICFPSSGTPGFPWHSFISGPCMVPMVPASWQSHTLLFQTDQGPVFAISNIHKDGIFLPMLAF